VIVSDDIEQYAEAHTEPADDLLERLAEETRATQEWPQMMVGPLQGRLLELLVRLAGAKLVLDIGTFTGYSSICMARGFEDGGRVVTCDVDEERVEIARRYATEAGVVDLIDYRVGPAIDTVRELEGPFDLVFIDADKGGYIDYYEAVLPKLAERGVIVADNVLSSGHVLDDEPEGTTAGIVAFNEHVRNDRRVVAVMLTVRDGLTLIRRR
jgi:caffeoyl-CoA O-methyltransferase